jgi:hypothetical protein
VRLLALVLSSVAACGPPPSKLDSSLPAKTAADFPPGPCHAGPDANPPPAGTKRVELHVATNVAESWLTVDGKTAYKDSDHHEACYTLDLPEGPHQVQLRAHSSVEEKSGLGIGLTVSEYGTDKKAWYPFFTYACGIDAGVCANDDFHDWQDAVEKDRSKEFDYCAASRPSQVRWETSEGKDETNPSQALLSLTLDIYPRVPDHMPGDKDCPEK